MAHIFNQGMGRVKEGIRLSNQQSAIADLRTSFCAILINSLREGSIRIMQKDVRKSAMADC
jgi:hypothetical protein